MQFNNKSFRNIIRNKSFLIILISQGISNMGDTFQLVAVTALLVKMTGSGLAAGFALICTPLPSLFISPFAGILGDKISGKCMLIIIDILRGAIVILFITNFSMILIYILILLVSSFDILYNPARNKVITGIIDNKDLVASSSLQSGVYGTAYILGPLIAGIVVEAWGLNAAFIVNSSSFFISALLISFVKYKKNYASYNAKLSIYNIFIDIKGSFCYSFKLPHIVELLEIGFIIGFSTASINIAFYSFAFDTFGITGRGWSIILSTLYGTNLIAMLLSMLFIKKTQKPSTQNIYILILIVSAIWFLYSMLKDLHLVILLQLIEGTSLSLISILLASYLLIEANKSYTARVTASSDFLNNIGKLISIAFAYMFLQIFKDRFLFVVNSCILLLFSIYKLSHR